MRRIGLVGSVLALCAGAMSAQQQPASRSAADEQQPIFRLSVDLVQLDAVVTDKKGRHVTTLGPGDFEVLQDGRPQQVVAATYVEMEDDWIDSSGLPPLPAEATRPADAQRVMAIVVDDSRMSFESIHHARRGLGEFVDEQFRRGDRAMLVTTSGYGLPSRLTSSPGTLKAAVNRLRYSLWGMRAASALEPLDGSFDPFDASDEFLERTFSVNAIVRIEQAIAAVKELPGRKSVILVSEGFSVAGFGMDNAMIRDALQRLVDHSNRAGVVIYAVDPRGLVFTGLTAADSTRGLSAQRLASLSGMRSAALRDSQDGLKFVAGETGGFAVVNSNDLARGFERIMTDQRGYYLIGYQPEAGTINPKSYSKFRRLKIKVKEKGMKVRTRAGFYARPTG